MPYEPVVVDMAAGEHKGEAWLRDVHPLGEVPALTIDGVTMFESATIVALLADRYLEKGLAPAIASPERAPYLQWLFFAMTTVEFVVVAAAGHKGDAEALQHDQQRFDDAVAPLAHALEGREWLLATERQRCVKGLDFVFKGRLRRAAGQDGTNASLAAPRRARYSSACCSTRPTSTPTTCRCPKARS